MDTPQPEYERDDEEFKKGDISSTVEEWYHAPDEEDLGTDERFYPKEIDDGWF